MEEIKEVLLIRLHMIRLKCNYRNTEDNSKCQFCSQEEETTEHIIFNCKKIEYLRQDIGLEETDIINDDSKSAVKLAKLMKRIML